MHPNDSELTYNQALSELEAILSGLRADNCDVDTLAERTARAAALLKVCRAKLTRTEGELRKVLEELDNAIES
ncbi:MAG: exodeoxyribonuclease VII small subunit [Muribaculaceae bacterium]|nr:exodeoxyribonuclease VII small subunit [Muribaculaceae bacterium]